MCGITGLFSLDNSPIDVKILCSMTDRLVHRGPDDEGIALFGNRNQLHIGKDESNNIDFNKIYWGGMGHRRLSIIDLATGAQPLCDKSGRFWIVFNGEIYNYVELRQELENEGVEFRTHSDTEVLLLGLITHDINFLNKINGMFAFAFLDQSKRRLLMVRDRIGIKPFHYTLINGSTIAFGSEIKSLLPIPNSGKTLDLYALRDYLSYRYIPQPRTIYKNIHQLSPGHLIDINLSSSTSIYPCRWWSLNVNPRHQLSLKQASEEFDNLFHLVCRDHMVSDVPLGVFLSGGLDSSSILAHTQKCSNEPLYSISVGVANKKRSRFDETDVASDIANHLGANLNIYKYTEDIMDYLSGAVDAMDQPMADPSVLPAYAMMQMVPKSIKVMLSGDGGDEVLGGYNRYRRTLNSLSQTSLSFIWRLLGISQFKTNQTHHMDRYLSEVSTIPINQINKMILPDFISSEPFRPINHRFVISEGTDPLTQWQQLDMQTYLVDDGLKKIDSISMAHSIEVRVPFLDHRIVEFGFSLPSHLRSSSTKGKIVLRHALGRHLPSKILRRPKIGFKVPLRSWNRRNNGCGALDVLMAKNQPVWKIVNRDYVSRWTEHRKSKRPKHLKWLWSLIVLNTWLCNNSVV